MRPWAVVLLLLLAGCAEPGRVADPHPVAAPGLAGSAPPNSGNGTLHAPRHVHVAWDGTTWEPKCDAEVLRICLAEEHVFARHELRDVGSDLWLNLTWSADDDANQQLSVRFWTSDGDAIEGLGEHGPSPMSIHVADPPSDSWVTVEGERTDDIVGYEDAPPQDYSARAVWIS